MTGAHDPDDDLFAAELAFGLLDAPDRAAAEERAVHDPGFAALCDRWQAHAVALLDDAGDMVPSAAVWAKIRQRLPANDDAAETQALRRSIRTWRSVSAALAVIALGAGAIALQRPSPRVVPPAAIAAVPPVIVLLTGAPDAGVMAISYDRVAGRLASTSSGLAIGPHAAELWVIPADQQPRSLGVLRANVADARIETAALRALIADGATLAISVEPAGGSPTGKPTGPVILSGKIVSS